MQDSVTKTVGAYGNDYRVYLFEKKNGNEFDRYEVTLASDIVPN